MTVQISGCNVQGHYSIPQLATLLSPTVTCEGR